jgi:hypothetical protein
MLQSICDQEWNRIASGKLPRQASVQFPDYVISSLSDQRQPAPILSTENGLNDTTSLIQRQSKRSQMGGKDAAAKQQQC